MHAKLSIGSGLHRARKNRSRGPRGDKQLWQVRYEWREANGAKREGRTVVTALSQAEADAKFQRQNQHVSVMHSEVKQAVSCSECGVPLDQVAACTCTQDEEGRQ